MINPTSQFGRGPRSRICANLIKFPTDPRILALVVFLFCLTPTTKAIDPNRYISQYEHTAWRIQDGFFSGGPNTIAQTADGYLWIGTQTGLMRFDGVRFIPWVPKAGQKFLSANSIFSLLATPDGSLWIGTGTNLARVKDGDLTNYSDGMGRVNAIVQDPNGAIWYTRSRVRDTVGPLCQVTNAKVRCYGKPEGIPSPFAGPLVTDEAGNFWFGSTATLNRWSPSSSASFEPPALKVAQGLSGIQALAVNPDGSLWVGINQPGPTLGLEQFNNGIWKSLTTPDLDGSTLDVSALYLDRQNTLWIGTDSHGIYRLHDGRVERFRGADGLTSDTITGFYEDREGDIWVATPEGLDCFRDLRVLSFSTREGLARNTVTSVLAGRDGTVWLGNGSLESLRDDKAAPLPATTTLPGKQVTSLLEDHAGRLWVGIDNGLWVYDAGTYHPIKSMDGAPLGIVIALTEDRSNNIWAKSPGDAGKLFRISDLAVQAEFPSTTIPASFSLAADLQDGVWLGLANGDLARFRQGKLETFAFPHDQNSRTRQVTVMSDGTVLGATPVGVTVWRNGALNTLTAKNGLPCESIFSTIEDAGGSLWLYAECGLLRVEKAEWQNWLEHPDRVIASRLFDSFDGVRPAASPFSPVASRGPDGRLWFANEYVVQVIDPAHLEGNALPPPVHIETVVADRNRYSPEITLRLPPRTRDLEIDYTALSFVTPQKVRFRYKLEGRDADWQEAGARREVFYSDLRPGNYHFHVIACNNDGVWNETGATFDFSIAPAWNQTIWFRVLVALVILLVAALIYRLRVRQIAHNLNIRFDERLAERTRLARELHDTFLQTIQGSKMVADDALEQNGDPIRLRRAMEKLSIWLGQAVTEGRDALNSLRASTTETNDLAAALRRAMETNAVDQALNPEFSVVGQARDLHPIVRDEIYRIGYEAIHNACLHSKATQLVVELKYEHDLTVRVKDNGQGIEPAIVAAGKDGHFGLTGMRERANRIGAKLTIESSVGAGTEITLIVPGEIAFQLASSIA